MEKRPMAVDALALQPFTTFDPNGVLLVTGTGPEQANVMTISWGMFGIMWGRPIMMVMVRPTRYSWEFITKGGEFTVNWMDDEWKDALRICGTASGRDLNKFATTGLTPVAATTVAAPAIAQSRMTLECRTAYRTDLVPDQFLDQGMLRNYPEQDYHGMFFGEILAAASV